MSNGDRTFDVVIVGTGVGGLVAAVRAKDHGLDPLVIEKTEYIGGTSVLSGGAIWLPDNPLMGEDEDSLEDALAYLEAVVGDAGPSSTPARQAAYILEGSRLLRFLQELGVKFLRLSHADYYPEVPGGHGAASSRVVVPTWFDLRRLGEKAKWVRPRMPVSRDRHLGRRRSQHHQPAPLGLVIADQNLGFAMLVATRTLKGKLAALRVVAQTVRLRLRGVEPLVWGGAIIGHLFEAALAGDCEFSLETPLRELLVENGRVAGVVVEREGRQLTIRARHGVVLSAGGFMHNKSMRDEYGPQPASVAWTATVPSDTGDAVRAAMNVGAATDLMGAAYWMPTTIGPDESVGSAGALAGGMLIVPERNLPHSIVVDGSGSRYANESANYTEFGRLMYERNETVPSIPSWLIIDRRHRRRYPLGLALPGWTPRGWIKSGFVKKARTLEELASACGIDSDGLARTVERFNRMVASGVDEDFGRGESEYDREMGDPTVKPNPCLGAIRKPPFYALALYPGDIGSAGGLVTDEHARVLREMGREPIQGLYACGTTAASAFGRDYIGGGQSIGQSAIFGFIAVEHLAGAAIRSKEQRIGQDEAALGQHRKIVAVGSLPEPRDAGEG